MPPKDCSGLKSGWKHLAGHDRTSEAVRRYHADIYLLPGGELTPVQGEGGLFQPHAYGLPGPTMIGADLDGEGVTLCGGLLEVDRDPKLSRAGGHRPCGSRYRWCTGRPEGV